MKGYRRALQSSAESLSQQHAMSTNLAKSATAQIWLLATSAS